MREGPVQLKNEMIMRTLMKILICCLVSALSVSAHAERTVVSRVAGNEEGKNYLEVDGRPYIFSNVQAMGTSHLYGHSWGDEPYAEPMPFEWLENMFEKTAAAGYETIAVMLYWRDIEPRSRGEYCWKVIDSYVDWCRKYDLRMEIIWYGTNAVGGARLQGFTNGWYPQIPQYLQDHDRYWGNGDSEYSPNDVHFPFLPSENPDAADLYQWERDAVTALFDHLADYDTSHRTILLQVMNEPNAYKEYYSEEYRDVIDRLAGAAKAGRYVVATCVNYTHHATDPYVEALDNIDFTGIDPYTDNTDLIQQDIYCMNSAVPYIAENDGKYPNMSKLMISALTNGAGAYNTWQLNNHWSDQGIYDPAAKDYKDWRLGEIPPLRPGAQATKRLLAGLNKISAIVAEAPSRRMTSFNLYGKKPFAGTSSRLGEPIGFSTGEDAAAMVVREGDCLYFVTDAADSVMFTVERRPRSVSAGYADEDGKWVAGEDLTCFHENGKYRFAVRSGECVRCSFDE